MVEWALQSGNISVIKFESNNERMCHIRIKGRFKNISIENFYAPTEEAEDDEKDEFYDMLEEEWNKLPSYDVKILLGDANAKVGRENIWQEVVGINSLHETSNDNGVRLLTLATALDTVVTSTKFPRKDIHKETWMSPSGNYTNQIDHVLIDRRHSSLINNVRTIRGADCGSDHFLVLVKVLQRIKVENKRNTFTKNDTDYDKLKEIELTNQFRANLANRFSLLNQDESTNDVDNIDENWNSLKTIVKESLKEVCGKKEPIKKKP